MVKGRNYAFPTPDKAKLKGRAVFVRLIELSRFIIKRTEEIGRE